MTPAAYEWRLDGHMQCPDCESTSIGVLETRESKYGIRRRRTCNDCRHRWSTLEMPITRFEELHRLVKRLREVNKNLSELLGDL